MMSSHADHKYSITIFSEDLAVIHCLRGLSHYCQKTGKKNITWGNTKESDWERAGKTVVFRFTSKDYRGDFVHHAKRLISQDLWKEVQRNDSDPAEAPKTKSKKISASISIDDL